MTDPNCIFCKIGAGEIPTNKVYEDDVCIAFRDMEPLMPVHVLIIPKENEKDIPEDHLGLSVRPMENVEDALKILFGDEGKGYHAG